MSSVTDVPIPGGWAEQSVAVAGRTFRLILPAAPDQFLEHLEAQGGDRPEEPDPYWAKLWPSALPMAEAVVRAAWPVGLSTLEIGCGIGLVGLAGLAKGLCVTFSDCVPLAVEMAVENARRNGFPHARGQLLDWRNPLAEQFPLILGSDLMYDLKNHGPLLGLLDRMLTGAGACWMGDPGRFHAQAFLQRAVEQGFAVDVRQESGASSGVPPTGCYQLIVLCRSAS